MSISPKTFSILYLIVTILLILTFLTWLLLVIFTDNAGQRYNTASVVLSTVFFVISLITMVMAVLHYMRYRQRAVT